MVYDAALEEKWKVSDDECLVIITGNLQNQTTMLQYSPRPSIPMLALTTAINQELMMPAPF